MPAARRVLPRLAFHYLVQCYTVGGDRPPFPNRTRLRSQLISSPSGPLACLESAVVVRVRLDAYYDASVIGLASLLLAVGTDWAPGDPGARGCESVGGRSSISSSATYIRSLSDVHAQSLRRTCAISATYMRGTWGVHRPWSDVSHCRREQAIIMRRITHRRWGLWPRICEADSAPLSFSLSHRGCRSEVG